MMTGIGEKIRRRLMNITQDFIPTDAKCSTHHGFDNGTPSVITIHWVGPYPGQTPKQVRDYWISSGGEASAHFIIKNNECLQCWPLDTVAWHAGCRAGNYTSLGIEVVPEDTSGKFSDASINTLKDLVKYINGVVKKKLPIVRHYDWTGKDCPKYYLDNNKWEELLSKISN